MIGLVLEGGAMRGLFTAGVIDVLMERGITFDGMIGVSAGAAFGCNYKSGQIGRVLRYNAEYCRDPRYCGFRSLFTTGNIFSTEFCYGEVPLRLDPFDFGAFERNPMRFYVVCTDIETGLPVYHEYKGYADHGFDWIRASASMPIVSQIVEIDSQKLLDGGVADSIPVQFFESIGYRRNVVVLTQPKGYVKQKNRALPLVRRKYRAYPRLIEAMERRHEMYNAELRAVEQGEADGHLFVIRPDAPIPVQRVERNPDHLRQAYALGRSAAEKAFPAMEEFLKRAKGE